MRTIGKGRRYAGRALTGPVGPDARASTCARAGGGSAGGAAGSAGGSSGAGGDGRLAGHGRRGGGAPAGAGIGPGGAATTRSVSGVVAVTAPARLK